MLRLEKRWFFKKKTDTLSTLNIFLSSSEIVFIYFWISKDFIHAQVSCLQTMTVLLLFLQLARFLLGFITVIRLSNMIIKRREWAFFSFLKILVGKYLDCWYKCNANCSSGFFAYFCLDMVLVLYQADISICSVWHFLK